jgi:Plant transposon protein
VLLSRFYILQQGVKLWDMERITSTVNCCVMLHNMVVESRRKHYESGMAHMEDEETPASRSGVSSPFALI